VSRSVFRTSLLVGAFLASPFLAAETVPVRYREGVVRGFLALRSTDGRLLGNGDLIQFPRGDRVVSRFVLRFPDGSVHDETAVFTQRDRFRLVSDHLIQRGRAFPHPIEVKIDSAKGHVNVRRRDDDGKEEVVDEDMELPADLANGMVLTLLKNISPQSPSTTVSMLFATPKPRLVRLVITPRGQEPFSVGRSAYKATRYNAEVEIGGLAGLVAGLLGKKPPDTSVWIVGGEAPGFVKSEGPMYQDGPIWRIELAAPDYGRR
jgi:hypothetical protein